MFLRIHIKFLVSVLSVVSCFAANAQELILAKLPANWSRQQTGDTVIYSNRNLPSETQLSIKFLPAVSTTLKPPQAFTQVWQQVKPPTDTLMQPRMRRLYTLDGSMVYATQAAAYRSTSAVSLLYLYFKDKIAVPLLVTAPDAKTWKQLQSTWDDVFLDTKWK